MLKLFPSHVPTIPSNPPSRHPTWVTRRLTILDKLKNAGQTKTSNLNSERFNSFPSFMILYPFLTLFLITLLTRTIIALSSHLWLIVWIALELNIISFIPLISSSNWLQESEASLKYLLFQALGSVLLLIGSINSSLQLLIILGLLIKAGAAPFHFWFPSVIKRISWPAATLLITWQKIAPVVIVTTSFPTFQTRLLAAGLTRALVGALGGLSQTHLRPLLAYSSIGHIGWIITARRRSPSTSIIYLSTYILISLPIILGAFKGGVNSLKKTQRPVTHRHQYILFPSILSLRGLPPLLGFMPKIIVLLSLNSLPALILIISSLTNLSYYLNFFFTIYLSTPSNKQRKKESRPSLILSATTMVATSPLPVIFILMYLI